MRWCSPEASEKTANRCGRRSAKSLGYLGVLIDSRKNAAIRGDTAIHAESSEVRVLVIHAREEWEIARECSKLLS